MSGSQFSVAGRVGSADTNDWYAFVIPSVETVNLDLSVAYGNPEMLLYSSATTQSLSYAYASQSADGWINEILQPGTYYVDIAATSDSQYTLQAFSGTPVISVANAVGTTLATATNIGTLTSTPTTYTYALTAGSESAFYAFNVSTISSVKLTLSGLSAGGIVYLRNAAGQQLAVTAYSPTSDASLIEVLGSLSPGNYYIDIEGYQTTATGYSLNLSATALTSNAGSSMATARAIGALGATTQSFSDTLNAITTQEFYSFTISAAARLNAVITGLTGGATLTLEDQLGNRITSVTSNANGSASLLTDLAPLSSGTYFLAVSGSNAPTTPYNLAVSAAPIVNAAGTSTSTATSLGTLATTPITISDFVGTVDPVDDYSFVLTTASTVNASLSAYSGDIPSTASLTLLNAANTPVVSAVTANAAGNALIETVLQPGTYVVAVSTNAADTPYTLGLSTGVPVVGTPATQNAGNSLATATDLGTLTAAGSTYADWVGPGNNTDYDKITLASPSLLNLQITGIAANNGVSVSLLDLAGNALQGTNGNNTQGASLLDEVAAGSYYIQISDNGGPGTGYSLSASATSLVTAAGSTAATADNIGNLGSLTSFSGFVGTPVTDNYYEFTIAAASVVAMDLSTRASAAVLNLRDVSGQSLLFKQASSSGDAIELQPLAAGTYYVDIQSEYGIAADYGLTLSATPIADPAGATQSNADLLGTLTNTGSNTIDAGSGTATVSIPGGAEYVTTEGNNTIVLSTGTPTVSATTGNPLVFGASSSMTFVGGSGAATVIGGSAGNTIIGGSGGLVLFAVSGTTYTPGTGGATIIGGTGGLTAALGAGGGEVFGGTGGVNLLSATNVTGTAALVGVGTGDQLTASGTGNDILVASGGSELLNASASTGNDVFFGGIGADTMLGGTGNDFFLAGTANETLSGGGGYNDYIFLSGTATRVDTVTDFNPAKDVIGLFGYGTSADAAALASATTANGSTTVTLPDGTTIVLPGVTHLTSVNFF